MMPVLLVEQYELPDNGLRRFWVVEDFMSSALWPN